MTYALTGAHRSGKSTVAKALAAALDLPYLDANVTPELLEMGFDQVAPMTPERRLECQEARLELFVRKLEAASRPLITDRTPLDIAAYSLAELVQMHTDQHMGALVADHVERCVRLTCLHFDTLIALRPLPTFTPEEGRAPPNLGYQWHIQSLVDGMMLRCQPKGLSLLWIPDHDHEVRVDIAGEQIARRMQAYQSAKETAMFH